MRYILIFYLVLLFSNLVCAHQTNEVFFEYIQKKKTVQVIAEFPWSIRNALIKFNHSLENSTNKKDFENTFREYINKNLILKNKNGHKLQFKEFNEIENKGHYHQNNFQIIFKGNNVFEIKNTIMFNLYPNQVNYNKVSANNKTQTFTTNKNATHFYLNEHSYTKYWCLLILTTPLIYIISRYSNKKSSIMCNKNSD